MKGSDHMSIISVRATEEEKEMIKRYAEFFGMSVSDFVKTSVIERIEDAFDLGEIEAYEKRKDTKEIQLYSLDEVKKQLGL